MNIIAFFLISRSCVNLWIMLFVILAIFNAVTTLQNVDFTSVSAYRDSPRKWRSSSMHNTQQKWCNRHKCLSCKLCFNYPCMLLVLHEVGRSLTAELNLFLEVVFSNILNICSRPIYIFAIRIYGKKKKWMHLATLICNHRHDQIVIPLSYLSFYLIVIHGQVLFLFQKLTNLRYKIHNVTFPPSLSGENRNHWPLQSTW